LRKALLISLLITLAVSSMFGWPISLQGAREDTVSESYFDSMKEHLTHYIEIGITEKSGFNRYHGMPLWLLIAMVDGNDSAHPYKFDLDRWEAGYEVTLVSSDGYSVTFDTTEMPVGQLYLADRKNGEKIAPSVVGNVSTKYMVKDLVAIEVMIPDLMAQQESPYAYELEFSIAGTQYRYSLEELKNSEFYIEKPGQYTTSAGTVYASVYGGIPVYDFLKKIANVTTEDTLKVIALDGYEMTYSMTDMADTSDGVWIFAFIKDGEPMPEDPGPVRTVKVGDHNPNIDGHLSAKLVKRVELAGKPFKAYTLSLKGQMDFDLDRQTIESGVSCHKKTVTYKSKSGTAEYTGIPLWRLLAYSDDPSLAPHKQDSSIISYNRDLAKSGYSVKITALDGYAITLRSEELDMNDDVIIATLKNGEELPEGEWPMILVWQFDSDRIPANIKGVKQVSSIEVITD